MSALSSPITGPVAWRGPALARSDEWNSVILHERTAHEDSNDPARKRHLLRLWLAAPDFEDGDEQLRRGIVIA